MISESWEMQGRTFYFEGDSSVTMENIELTYINDTLYYIPTVYGQNDDKPVPFYATKIKKEQFIVENPDHDFPKKIQYRKTNDKSMSVEISGFFSNKYRILNFKFSKTD